MYNGKKIGVVLPAAGVGRRFGADKPKQLLCINGVEIYRHTVNAFLACPFIDEIVFVASAEYSEQFRYEFSATSVQVVTGGVDRWLSVKNGVFALSSAIEYVLIHDVARPFVSAQILEETIKTVIEKGSCIVAKPVSDTVKVVKDGVISSTIDRQTVFLAQTPQAFSRATLQDAYRELGETPVFTPTDEASIMEYLKQKVYIVQGNTWNDKVTTADDLLRFEQMIKEM